MSDLLSRYASTIIAASEVELREDITLGGRLILDSADGLSVSYAPFEHINPRARIVILGITPGIQQAANALIEVRRLLCAGAESSVALSGAKSFASFSGPMRSNLVSILDFVGLANWLGVPSTQELWAPGNEVVHFTSALRYPILINGSNYAGNPSMTRTPILRRWLRQCLAEEAQVLQKSVWVPLGPKPAEATALLIKDGLLNRSLVLDGLPHPSGANAERISYFLGRKERSRLSAKTRPEMLDKAKERLTSMVAALRAISE